MSKRNAPRGKMRRMSAVGKGERDDMSANLTAQPFKNQTENCGRGSDGGRKCNSIRKTLASVRSSARSNLLHNQAARPESARGAAPHGNDRRGRGK